jgi:UDP-N-acetylmuramyl pentapeptide phosphotransferase/UDP-N-acetylglucosamine-1-phosphate transferase
MDGINGITALNAAVAGGWYAWLGNHYALPGLATLGLAVVGSSLGFLPWNAPEARIFLGDVGSYALGLLLGGMAVVAWSSGVPLLLCIAPFTFYLVDTAWVLVKRATGHRPLTEAHREHVYQRLVDGGWTHLAAAGLTAVGAGASCVVSAIWDERPLAALLLTAALVLAYLVTPGVTTGRPAQARVRS